MAERHFDLTVTQADGPRDMSTIMVTRGLSSQELTGLIRRQATEYPDYQDMKRALYIPGEAPVWRPVVNPPYVCLELNSSLLVHAVVSSDEFATTFGFFGANFIGRSYLRNKDVIPDVSAGLDRVTELIETYVHDDLQCTTAVTRHTTHSV